jgi:hypothetical protein
MGVSVGHIQPHLLICYEFKGQSRPPFETKLPKITHSQRPILKPNICACLVDLISKRATPFSCQIHRTSWLSLNRKHPEYQSKPAFSWVKKGYNPMLKTTSGCARVNIHGALNLETFDTPFVSPITVDGVSAV